MKKLNKKQLKKISELNLSIIDAFDWEGIYRISQHEIDIYFDLGVLYSEKKYFLTNNINNFIRTCSTFKEVLTALKIEIALKQKGYLKNLEVLEWVEKENQSARKK